MQEIENQQPEFLVSFSIILTIVVGSRQVIN